MAVATFDTLKFANTLKEAGVPPQQAEAQARAFAEVIQLNFKELVTKDDLSAATREVKQEIVASELRQGGRLDKVESDLRGQNVLLRWMLGATFGGVLLILGLLARLLVVLPR